MWNNLRCRNCTAHSHRRSIRAETVDQQTVAWAARFSLLLHDSSYQRLHAARVGWLMARTYPFTSPTWLQFLADWSTWLLVWDDLCSESGLANQPDRLQPMAQHYLALLRGASADLDDNPLALALIDLRDRLLPASTPEWQSRFVAWVEEFFDACLWEATNRATARSPMSRPISECTRRPEVC